LPAATDDRTLIHDCVAFQNAVMVVEERSRGDGGFGPWLASGTLR
jgi:hypothetical protein